MGAWPICTKGANAFGGAKSDFAQIGRGMQGKESGHRRPYHSPDAAFRVDNKWRERIL